MALTRCLIRRRWDSRPSPLRSPRSPPGSAGRSIAVGRIMCPSRPGSPGLWCGPVSDRDGGGRSDDESLAPVGLQGPAVSDGRGRTSSPPMAASPRTRRNHLSPLDGPPSPRAGRAVAMAGFVPPGFLSGRSPDQDRVALGSHMTTTRNVVEVGESHGTLREVAAGVGHNVLRHIAISRDDLPRWALIGADACPNAAAGGTTRSARPGDRRAMQPSSPCRGRGTHRDPVTRWRDGQRLAPRPRQTARRTSPSGRDSVNPLAL